MKRCSFLNFFLLITLLGGAISNNPVPGVYASTQVRLQENSTQKLAYISSNGNAWLTSSDGKNGQQLTFDGGYTDLAWAPNSQRLALIKSKPMDNRLSLYVKDLSNNPPEKVSDGVLIFAWDPHGDRIAYYSDQIHIYSVSQKEVVTTIAANYPYKWLFWDDAGEEILYFSYDIGGINSVNINTKKETLIFSKPQDAVGPLSFEELKYFASTGYFWGWDYESEGSGIPVIIESNGKLVELGTDTVKALYPDQTNIIPITGYPSADWSPDGNRVVYGDNWNFGNGDLFLLDIDSYQITVLPGKGINPRWSPDGKQIAFTSQSGGLYLLDIERTNTTQLLPDVPDQYLDEICGFGGCSGYSSTVENEPIWSANGTHIILPFKTGFSIFGLETQSSNWIEGGISPEWQPTLNVILGASITDLKVQPVNFTEDSFQNRPFPVRLSWNFPDGVEESIKDTIEFEVRMSESPLSDTNWEEAQIFEEHVKLVATGPIDVIKNLPEGSLNKELYFGVKARNHKGEWSTISNVVKYVDSGFRSNIDGYQFSNGTQDWGVYPEVEITRNDFTDADFYRMFKEKMGVKEICQENTDSGRNCVLKKKYSLWVEDKKQRTNIGRCLGMVVTSLILFDNPSSLSPFSQTLTVYSDEVNLKDQKVRSFITYYHVEQYASPFRQYYDDNKNTLPSKTLSDLETAIKNKHGSVIALGQMDSTAHAVTPVAISQESESKTIVYVYDNQNPGEIRNIQVFPGKENWKYSDGERSLQGQQKYFFIAIPVDIFTQPQHLPISRPRRFMLSINAPIGSSMIANSKGELIETTAGELVNNIKEAEIAPIIAFEGSPEFEPNLLLPSNDSYRIHLSRPLGTNQEPTGISSFGKDYGLLIEGIVLPNVGEDIVAIVPENYSYSYQVQEDQELFIRLALEKGGSEYLFALSNIYVDSNKEMALRYDQTTDQLILHPGSSQAFSLGIDVTQSGKNFEFSHQNIQLPNTGSIAFEIGSWNATQALVAQLDYDGDGKYDEAIKINNQASLTTRIMSSKFSGIALWGVGFVLFVMGTSGLLLIRRKNRNHPSRNQ